MRTEQDISAWQIYLFTREALGIDQRPRLGIEKLMSNFRSGDSLIDVARWARRWSSETRCVVSCRPKV